MKFPAKQSVDFTPVPAGNHIAICNAVVDLGWQNGSVKFPDPKPQVYIRFELPNERLHFKRDGVDVEGPMVIGRMFTASMSKKASLRAFVESFYAKKFTSDEKASEFDVAQMIGNHCMLNVSHAQGEDRVYANIAGVAPIPKGMKGLQGMENEALSYDLTDPDESAFQLMPKWLQEKIDSRLPPPPAKTHVAASTKIGPEPTEQFVDDELDKAF